MRQNPNSRRSRGRGGRKPGNPRNQIFDSNGPGARVRGNSSQIYEKYQQLARDASSSGDRIAAENFYQHAEHYYRLMEAAGLNRNGSGQDDAQPRNEGGAVNGESADAPQPSAEPSPKATPVAIDAATDDAAGRQTAASPDRSNGSGAGDGEAKPARRTRSRRANGAANGQNPPDKNVEADAKEDGSPASGEDADSANA